MSACAFRYRLYGLTVVSDIELAGVPTALPGAPSDVEFVRAPVPRDHFGKREDDPTFVNGGDRQWLLWAAVGAFCVVSDRRVEVDPNTDTPDSLIALPLLGTVLATVLHRRGLYVLHASAVGVDGRAVALLGDKGAGKSTTAVALLEARHQLLADDVVAIDFSGTGAPLVQPAYGRIKLWADARDAFGGFGLVDRGRLVAGIDKSAYNSAHFATAALPLGRLYVLRRGPVAGTAAFATADAVAALLRYAYMGRFADTGFGGGLAVYFRRSAILAAAGRVRWLDVPAGVARLGETIAVIAADLEIESAA